jgi:hypothetical protein
MPGPENNFYPPWQLRFEVVWKHAIEEKKLQTLISSLNDKEISQAFEKHMNAIEAFVSAKKGISLVEKHPHAKIAYKNVTTLLPQAAEFVNSAIPTEVDRWDDSNVIKQIPALVQRLKSGIPPNEIVFEVSEVPDEEKYNTSLAAVSAIVNAGWIYETHWQQSSSEDTPLLQYNTILRLVLKALDDICEISLGDS